MRFWKYLELSKLRPPELICFDHLYGEYRSMKNLIPDEEARFIEDLAIRAEKQEKAARANLKVGKTKESKEENVEPVKEKADEDGPLSWDELYYFELIMADHMPAEKLKTKIVRLRSDFSSIVSEKEYSDYLASKPPELQNPPDAENPPEGDKVEIQKIMRADLKDLLDRIYMKYTVLPIRETRLTDLTLFAAGLCLAFLIVLLVVLLIVFLVPLAFDIGIAISKEGLAGKWIEVLTDSPRLSSLTIFVVVVAGAMGGFVSALQRIQSPATEGDSMYNLSLLFYGSKSVFVAPVTGAIFATLLYLMFAAGILQGTFFPKIYTPPTDNKPENSSSSNPKPTPTPAPSPGPPAANIAGTSPDVDPATNNAANQNSAGNTTGAATPKSGPTVAPAPTTNQSEGTVSNKGLNVFEFLAKSGPIDGVAYALLIIWCFIAGFAERFVPDALDRLISNSKTSGTK